MPITKQPHAEPIPGYRLIAPLGTGGFGEVWKCEAPGGLFKAIKFVYGNLNQVNGESSQAHEELRAFRAIKDIRHPFLLSIDRVEYGGGELMIVTELADKNLHELLLHYQAKGLPGVPRPELLRYLLEAAEVLDLMNEQHGLLHLDIKPRNLFLVSRHVKVADFGLVTSLVACAGGIKPGAVTPLYASPEVFQGKVSKFSDQYSLACCYMELLTGKLPFEGRNCRQLLVQHINDEPDLSPLPEADRPIIARALAKDPACRFPSCVALVRALQGKPDTSLSDVDLTPLVNAAVGTPHPAAKALSDPLVQTPGPRKNQDTERPSHRLAPAGFMGYAFVQNLGSSPLADTWKVKDCNGNLRQLRFVYGFSGRAEDAVRRLRALQHPALARVEVLASEPGRLVLLTDLARETARDRQLKCQQQKLQGIPRLELLGYLRPLAEALDYFYDQHSLQHLLLNPRCITLDDDGVQLTEFGLAQLFWLPAGQSVAQYNARFAAPELFDRQVSRSTDQYSLALIFQELLTGRHAFSGQSRVQGLEMRARMKPDLSALARWDQEIVARALDVDPRKRWANCTEFVKALEDGDNQERPPSWNQSDAFVDVLGADQPTLPTEGCAPPEAVHHLISDLIAQAGGAACSDDALAPPAVSEGGTVLQHRFRAGLPVGAARVKIDAYRRQCDGKVIRDDEEATAFHISTPSNFWQQWLGRQPGLEVETRLTRQHALSATPIDVVVTIRAVDCSAKRGAQLIDDLGRNLLEGLRAFLLMNSEKRTHDRLLWPHPLKVRAVEKDGSLGPLINCRGKDISASGMGFYLPHELPTSGVMIELPATSDGKALRVPATLVRANRCADGWYDVGALFRLVTLRQSMPELTAN